MLYNADLFLTWYYLSMKQKFVRYSGLDLDPSLAMDERVALHDDVDSLYAGSSHERSVYLIKTQHS
jgi:hypothetical protein